MQAKNNKILKDVSRSFYLSCQLSPKKIRDTIGLAFLFCKIDDTIADTELLPLKKRLESLNQYRQIFLQQQSGHLIDEWQKNLFELLPDNNKLASAGEYDLLTNAASLFRELKNLSPQDQDNVCWLLPELTQGMQTDLIFFANHANELRALPDNEALEKYTYDVAGCVGIFWTRVLKQHYNFAKQWPKEAEDVGERFGKGLQMVNILRDLPQDLLNGRCYLPAEELQDAGIKLEQLLEKEELVNVKPVLQLFISRAKKYLSAGSEYIDFLPRNALRLRASISLPMDLGFKTLELLEHDSRWLSQNHLIKVKRIEVYKSLLKSLLS